MMGTLSAQPVQQGLRVSPVRLLQFPDLWDLWGLRGIPALPDLRVPTGLTPPSPVLSDQQGPRGKPDLREIPVPRLPFPDLKGRKVPPDRQGRTPLFRVPRAIPDRRGPKDLPDLLDLRAIPARPQQYPDLREIQVQQALRDPKGQLVLPALPEPRDLKAIPDLWVLKGLWDPREIQAMTPRFPDHRGLLGLQEQPDPKGLRDRRETPEPLELLPPSQSQGQPPEQPDHLRQ